METELSRVVDALPGFVWTALPDGQIDFLNQRWCEYTGLPLGRSCGRGWQAAVHPEDLSRLLTGWQGDAASGVPVETEARVRAADGEYRWFLFRAHPSADASGQVVKWCGLSTDIDRRRQAEEAVRARERRFRSIVDGLPVLLSTATPDGELEQANRHYLEYFGATLAELKARESVHSVHPDDRARVLAARSEGIGAGRPYEIECRRRRADGVYRWFFLRAFPLRDSNGRIAQWYRLHTDIEDQNRAEALLAGEKRLLEMVASGHPMPDILQALCRLVESTASGSYCSIVLVDPGGTKLQETIAPSLAPEFNDAVRGWPLDRLGGPCVMAARDKTQVIMSDVASDARWRDGWRALAQKHGLRSCWSTPMVSQAGTVLGTFALYQREPGTPGPFQLDLIAQFTNIASIAIERAQRDAALRQSEARLAEAERDLRLTIDTIPVFVAAYRPDGTRSFVNRKWQEYTGLSLEEATGPGAKTFPHFHPADAEAIDAAWRTSLASGQPLLAEARARRADGQYRWHTSHRVPLRDGEGNIVRWYSVGIDIEDRKAAEDALRRSEARLAEAERELQTTIDTIPTLVAAYRPDGLRIFVNQTWLDYTGLSFDNALDVERAIHPDDAARVTQGWQNALAEGVPFKTEMRLRRADGEYRWHSVHRVFARDEAGAIVKWYSVGVDIEERKRAEEALRESERNSRLIVDSIPGQVAIFGPGGEFEFVNRQVLEFFGATLDDVTSKRRRTRETLHPEDLPRATGLFKQSIASGQPFEFEVRGRRFDGVYRWFQSRGLPLRDTSGHIVRWLNLLIDIDERKHAEEALRQSEAELAEAERELRVTLDSIPAITWRAAPNGYVQQLNKRWFEYTGTTPEQVRGGRWKSCVHPDDLGQLIELGTKYVASGEAFDSEARLRRFDGEYRWFLFRPAPVRDESGKVVAWYGTITDIEDRKRAEEKAGEAERELQHMLDSIPTMIVRGATNGYIEYLNKPWFEYTGATLETARGFRWQQSLHPDDKDRLVEFGARFVATAEPADCEARLRRFDGTYRWFLFRPAPARDAAGKFVGWYGTVTDIEDRKRAEEKAGEAERELQRTIDTIPAMVGTYTGDGERQSVNKWAREYTGRSVENWMEAFHPDDVESIEARWCECLAKGEPLESEHRVLAADGTYRWILTRRVPLRDEAGKVIRWYGIAHDIEDRKRAEEELRRSETLLAEGQRISSTGTYAWSGDLTERMLLSEEFYRIFEFEQDSAVTFARLMERFHPEDLPLMAERVERIDAGLENPEFQFRLRMPDSRIKYLRVLGRVIRHQDGRLERIGAVQDITRNRQAEEALDKVRTELARVTRVMSLGALTASIAHEVNQPLAGIVTNASTCLRMLAADPPNVEGARETARRTIRDGNRAADVITRLRALFSKKAAAPDIVDLGEAAQEILALVSADLLRSRINVRAELGREPLLVNADRVQLQQVILNLVRNAIDAMSGVHDRPRDLLIRTTMQEDEARLIVKDAGVGIEAQTAERLFEAFYTTKSDGMGIGLSVSRSIVESHGGRLWAEPNDGPGTTFTFSIPRQATSEDESAAGAIPTRPARGARELAGNA